MSESLKSDLRKVQVLALEVAVEALQEECEALRKELHQITSYADALNERCVADAPDAERYRWLRDLKCCSFTLGHNDAHAPSYMTASDWIDDNPEWFVDTPDAELRRMRDSNTIWTLQVYPRTPVAFYLWHAATLDAAIDAAIAKEQP